MEKSPTGINKSDMVYGSISRKTLKAIKKGKLKKTDAKLCGYHRDHKGYIVWDNRGKVLKEYEFMYPDDCYRWLTRK
jgi:hypothetical protein